MSDLGDILKPQDAVRLATGYVFTEGPLWHPDGFYYFNDIRPGALYRMVLGETPELIRRTDNANGMTFDLEGRQIHCEGFGRRLTRTGADGVVETLVDRFEGRRFNRPNDVICRSDGSLYFTDPSYRVPFAEREQPGPEGVDDVWGGARVYRVFPDGRIEVVFECEYPNGLAFSPDERTLYVANTRLTKYIHAVDLDAAGRMTGRRIFADLSAGDAPGIPDGMKVDEAGRVYCTGPGGIWVHEPDGRHMGIIELPEMAVNFCFGGEDLKTLFVCAVTSVYTLGLETAGDPLPWYRVRDTADRD